MGKLVLNPKYASAYQEWCGCDSELQQAVNNAKAGANNWKDINAATHKLANAKNNLLRTPQYVEAKS